MSARDELKRIAARVERDADKHISFGLKLSEEADFIGRVAQDGNDQTCEQALELLKRACPELISN